LECGVIHLFLIFIFFILPLRYFLVVERRNFPRETNFGFLVLFRGVDDWPSSYSSNRLIACSKICIAAFVV
jgi:hypothetical protein